MSGLSLKHDAWVLVGDGEKAMLFRNKGDAAYPDLEIIDLFENSNPKTSDQGADRPGRHRDSVGSHKSAFSETDWHRLEKHRFAKDLSDSLYRAAHAGRFERLVVAAPPATLGDLRKEMRKEVSDRVVAEVPKDLTNMPLDEIERILTTK